MSSNVSSRPSSMLLETHAAQSTGERPASTHGTPTSSELTELPYTNNSTNVNQVTSGDMSTNRNRYMYMHVVYLCTWIENDQLNVLLS